MYEVIENDRFWKAWRELQRVFYILYRKGRRFELMQFRDAVLGN